MLTHATEKLEGWVAARRRAGRMLVALDFDGTLAPIVPRPADAALPPATEAILRRLVARPDTDLAVVSGRALEDVRRLVPIHGVYFAGNHGMEIDGPGVDEVYEPAAEVRPRLAACAESLRHAVGPIAGVVMEDKGLTLSVHYRLVEDPAEQELVRSRVHGLCGRVPGLRVTSGKKVIEVRPDVNWDKGRAVQLLLAGLQAGPEALLPVLFIGDDVTDEDAFRALDGTGDGVVVAAQPPEDTAASAWLRDPDEVAHLLAALADAA